MIFLQRREAKVNLLKLTSVESNTSFDVLAGSAILYIFVQNLTANALGSELFFSLTPGDHAVTNVSVGANANICTTVPDSSSPNVSPQISSNPATVLIECANWNGSTLDIQIVTMKVK
jgi:hypothetical protein